MSDDITSILKGWGEPAYRIKQVEDARRSGIRSWEDVTTLPKALRDWPAYRDCRATIDDFLDLLPLFQALTHRAIRDRSCLAELGLAGAGAWAGAGLTRWTGWWAVEQGSVQAAASSLPACLPAHPARSSRCSSPPTPSPTRRHWAELMSLTGRQLNLAEDVFKLQHLLDANMLARRCGGSR